jgi:hypothetical protein
LAGDVLSVNYTSALFADKNVASAKPVLVTGITVTGPDARNYAYKNTSNTAADITPRALSVRFDGGNKIYDGKIAATVDARGRPGVGRRDRRQLHQRHVCRQEGGVRQAGDGERVEVTGLDAGNYAYKIAGSTAADITPRALAVTLIAQSKVYDGNTGAVVTTQDDRVAGDALTINVGSATFAEKKVGIAKLVTVNGLTVTGPDAGNYAYKIAAVATADITPRSLAIRFNGGNKIYDGKLAATVIPSDDRVSGDVLTVNYSSALFLDKNVAIAKPVNVAGISVTGPDAGNYTYKDATTTAADITPRPLHFVCAGTGNKVYDGKVTATLTCTDDRIPGDVFTINYGSATFADKNVGSAKPVTLTGITVTGPDGGNYAFKDMGSTTADITNRAL